MFKNNKREWIFFSRFALTQSHLKSKLKSPLLWYHIIQFDSAHLNLTSVYRASIPREMHEWTPVTPPSFKGLPVRDRRAAAVRVGHAVDRDALGANLVPHSAACLGLCCRRGCFPSRTERREVGRKKALLFKSQLQKVLRHTLKNKFLHFYVSGKGLETNTRS